MKQCSYCGTKYRDDATVCDIDGELLHCLHLQRDAVVVGRKKITGVWRGVYGSAQTARRKGFEPVTFTLKLKQGWLQHFTGLVTEDTPHGTLETGTIDGYFDSPQIEFTKQMPVGYVTRPDGTRMALREYILAEGHKCDHDLPAPPILYQGIFLDANRVQGTWIISPRRLHLKDNLFISPMQASGFWCAEFVTTDAKVNPTCGPTELLFDKALLSPRELYDVEGAAFLSLSMINVANAKKLLERFRQENIRFELRQDKDVKLQMMPITEVTGGSAGTASMFEIFVHPDDEDKALEIMGEDDET